MKHKREFRIGLVSFVILIAFIWGVNFIMGHNIFSPNYSYYAIYPSSGGLQTGRPVKINGVTVGLVSNIKFYSSDLDSVTVRFDVDKKYRFTKNSVAEISSGTSLMSDVEMNVVVMPGGMLAEDGDTLGGILNGGLSDMIKNTVMPIRKSMIETLASLDSVLKNMNSVLSEENKTNLGTSLTSLSVTLENAQKLSANLNELLEQNNGNIQQITSNLAGSTQKINTLLDTLSAEGFVQSISDLKSTLANLKDITDKVNSGDGTVSKLLNDPQIYDNLTSATQSLDALLADVKANPKRYVNITVFGKKERSEKNKVKDSLAAARLRSKSAN